VITPDRRTGSVPLPDLVKDPKWQAAVEASPLRAHFLTCMEYDDFVHSPTSRVLSYRWSQKFTVDCAVEDPAGVVTRIGGEINAGVLETPPDGWSALWADFLCHLNDPSGLASCLKTMGNLYLTTCVLPQYFLLGNLEAAEHALSRGWMHQELSFGELDRRAVEGLLRMCCHEHIVQTGGRRWCMNPFDLKGPQKLSLLVAKRFKSASVDSHLMDDLQEPMENFGLVNNIEGYDWSKNGRFTTHGDVNKARQRLDPFIDSLASRQVSENTEENLQLFMNDPAAAWSVIIGAANSNFWDPSDAYYASLAVVGAACGLTVQDPLSEYKLLFPDGNWPKTPRGTISFSPSDLNLATLNRNYEILRTCWNTLLPMPGWTWRSPEGYKQIPNALRDIGSRPPPRVDLTSMPPGAGTLGLGPVRLSHIANGKLTVGESFGFAFTEDFGAYTLHNLYGDGNGTLPLDEVGCAYDIDKFTSDYVGSVKVGN